MRSRGPRSGGRLHTARQRQPMCRKRKEETARRCLKSSISRAPMACWSWPPGPVSEPPVLWYAVSAGERRT